MKLAILAVALAVVGMCAFASADCKDDAFTLFTAHNDVVKYFYEMLRNNKNQHADCNDALQKTNDQLHAGLDLWNQREFFDATENFRMALEEFKATYTADTCNMDYGANAVTTLGESLRPALQSCADVSRQESDSIVDDWYQGDRGLDRPSTDSAGNIEQFDVADAKEGFWVFTNLNKYVDGALAGVSSPFSTAHKVEKLLHKLERNHHPHARGAAVVRSIVEGSGIDLKSPQALLALLKQVQQA